MTPDKERLVEENLALVGLVIKKHFRSWLDMIEYEDLFQYGCLGLIAAAEAYDPGMGYKFSSLATKAIKNEILHLMQSKRKRDNVLHPKRDVRLDAKTIKASQPDYRDSDTEVEANFVADPNDVIGLAELKMDIDQVIARLRPEQQQAYHLYVELGLTFREAGPAVGRTRVAIHNSMQAVRKHLRKAGIHP